MEFFDITLIKKRKKKKKKKKKVLPTYQPYFFFSRVTWNTGIIYSGLNGYKWNVCMHWSIDRSKLPQNGRHNISMSSQMEIGLKQVNYSCNLALILLSWWIWRVVSPTTILTVSCKRLKRPPPPPIGACIDRLGCKVHLHRAETDHTWLQVNCFKSLSLPRQSGVSRIVPAYGLYPTVCCGIRAWFVISYQCT